MAEGISVTTAHSAELTTYSSDFFPALDTTTLTRFAKEPLEEYDPVKLIAKVAFNIHPPLLHRETKTVIEDVGRQIDPPETDNATPAMAAFLRRATGEGVYPYRIASNDAWQVAAETISSRQILLGTGTARALLYFAGVGRGVIQDSLSLASSHLSAVTAHIIEKVHANTDTATALTELIRPRLRPLCLWPLSTDTVVPDNIGRVMGGIFEKTALGREGDVDIRNVSTAKQLAVLDALSTRYLERPPSIKSRFDPHKSIDMLRQRCTMMVQTVAEEYDLNIHTVFVTLRNIRDSLRAGMTEKDVQLIKDFIEEEDKDTALTLPRLPLYTIRE